VKRTSLYLGYNVTSGLLVHVINKDVRTEPPEHACVSATQSGPCPCDYHSLAIKTDLWDRLQVKRKLSGSLDYVLVRMLLTNEDVGDGEAYIGVNVSETFGTN
jgi:hypothetical protein